MKASTARRWKTHKETKINIYYNNVFGIPLAYSYLCIMKVSKKVLMAFVLALFATPSMAQETYKELVQEAMHALEMDSLSIAEGLFRQALKAEPSMRSNALLFKHIGEIQERQGRHEEALQSYGLGINLSPTTLSLLLNRASLYLRMNNEQRAMADYNAVLDLNADHPEALFFRAYIYVKQRLYKEARIDYEHLIRLEPANEKARMGLALLNDKDGRPHEAMQQMDMLINLFPSHAELYAVRGGMEQSRKQYEVALRDFNKAIQLEPNIPDYYLMRAAYYQAIRNKKKARLDVQRASDLGATAEEIAAIVNANDKKTER